MSALSGFKVLELAEGVAGEYCGKLLADFGAELVKIEKPGTGSPTRRMGPLAADGPEPERSGLFAYLNTNKRSVALDLAQADARSAVHAMLGRVDVLIDDHGDDWLRNLGLDADRLRGAHPHLVLCTITPFGASPPDGRRHAEDLSVFHASGWGFHTPSGADAQRPPLKHAGRFLPSYEAALDAALCVVAALYERQASQRGRCIDISQQQVLAARMDYVLAQMVAGDMDVSTRRAALDLAGPAGIFRCRDGYAYIWMSAPPHWDALRKLLGAPAWMDSFPERWLERACTPERVAECRRHLAGWLATQDRNEVAAQAHALGLMLVPVNDARDLAASPQYAHRGFFAELAHPVLGRLRHPTVPYKLGATPARLRTPAPLLGQHTQAPFAPELPGDAS